MLASFLLTIVPNGREPMNHFRTYDLACDFYHKVEAVKLASHLRDQLLRAASLIALNLGREMPNIL
jgi:hypothetical protein